MKDSTKIFIVGGEASADLHGANLIRNLRNRSRKSLSFFGVGGEKMEFEGVELIAPARDLNVVGISDWFDKAGKVIAALSYVKKEAVARKPDLAILMDLPDFNLLLAKHLKRHGIPVVYYISPQVWAWRKYRIRRIRKYIDRMLVLFPFEEKFYKSHGVDVEFVGHPLLDSTPRIRLPRSHREIVNNPRIAILPGSRHSELKYHLKVLAETMKGLMKHYPKVSFHVPIASTVSRSEVSAFFEGLPVEYYSETKDCLKVADIGLVASGTATLEVSLSGTPFILFYKVSRSSGFIFSLIIRYKGFIGMPNVILNREAFPEVFQQKFSSETLIREAMALIKSESKREEQSRASDECRTALGEGGSTDKAAQSVLSFLGEAHEAPALGS